MANCPVIPQESSRLAGARKQGTATMGTAKTGVPGRLARGEAMAPARSCEKLRPSPPATVAPGKEKRPGVVATGMEMVRDLGEELLGSSVHEVEAEAEAEAEVGAEVVAGSFGRDDAEESTGGGGGAGWGGGGVSPVPESAAAAAGGAESGGSEDLSTFDSGAVRAKGGVG